jgi:CRP/FNR family transcriptional regulator
MQIGKLAEIVPIKSLKPLVGLGRFQSEQASAVTDKQVNQCERCPHRKTCVAKDIKTEMFPWLDQSLLRQRSLQKGRQVYWQNSPFKAVYIVRVGIVKTYQISSQGSEQTVGFHFPGDLIGADGFYNGLHLYSAVTLDVAGVCILPFEKISRMLSNNQDFQKRFLSAMSGGRYEEQKNRMFLNRSAEQRLAYFILFLSKQGQHQSQSPLIFQLNILRKDIANYLGMAIETVSRNLTMFQQRGWISIEGNEVTLSDKPALEQLL